MKYIKRDRYDDLLIKLTEDRMDIQDIYLDRNFGYHYSKEIPSNWKVSKVRPYIKVKLLLFYLKEDLRKIEHLMKLDNGCDYTSGEMGFVAVPSFQDYFGDDHLSSLQSVKSYIEQLIQVLEKFIEV